MKGKYDHEDVEALVKGTDLRVIGIQYLRGNCDRYNLVDSSGQVLACTNDVGWTIEFNKEEIDTILTLSRL